MNSLKYERICINCIPSQLVPIRVNSKYSKVSNSIDRILCNKKFSLKEGYFQKWLHSASSAIKKMKFLKFAIYSSAKLNQLQNIAALFWLVIAIGINKSELMLFYCE